MFFASNNLIDVTIATRAVRSTLAKVIATSPPLLDREQIAAALSLACNDLDVADPLYVIRTISVTDFTSQTNPSIPVSSKYLGNDVVAVFDPAEITDANQIPFDSLGNYRIRPHCIITSDNPMMSVVIRWPRAIQQTPALDNPDPANCWDDVKTWLITSTNDKWSNNPDSDNVQLFDGDRVLHLANVSIASIANGIYYYDSKLWNWPRPDDAHLPLDYVLHKTVRIMAGETYPGTVWECLTVPTDFATDAIQFSMVYIDSNVDVSQAVAHIIPRAAAYLGLQLAGTIVDKNVAASVMAWATALLARPLPAAAQAISQRIYTGTEYAAN